MKKLYKIFIFFILIFSTFESIAQTFEWLRAYSGENIEHVTLGSVTDNKGNTYLLNTSYKIPHTFPNSTSFDNFKFNLNGNQSETYLVKIDSSGKVINIKNLGYFGPPNYLGNIFEGFFFDVSIDDSANINFIIKGTGYLDSVYLYSGLNSIISIKYDSSLTLKWHQIISNNIGVSFPVNHPTIANRKYGAIYGIWGFKTKITKDNRLYVLSPAIGKCSMGNDSFDFPIPPWDTKANDIKYVPLYFTYILSELDAKNGNVLWAKTIYKNEDLDYINCTDFSVLDDKIYISGNYHGTTYMGNDTLDGTGAFVMEFNDTGKYEKVMKFSNGNEATIKTITTEGNHLYMAGNFQDSISWFGQTIQPQNNKTDEMFFASTDKELKPRWFYQPVEKYARSGKIYKSFSADNFLYFGGNMYGEIDFQGIKIGPAFKAGPNGGDTNILFLKTDTLGNVLWAGNGKAKGAVRAFSGQGKVGIYIAGEYTDTLTLGNTTVVSAGPHTDIYLAKINDYSISRDSVFPGPYCAGDTIKVPYTAYGTYGDSNEFIAELSDENGNFDSSSFELGRLKTNVFRDTIKGFLPLFDVASSAKYRIRVRSTFPAIQSYYKFDSLKLLIYSKDTANAGIDRIICKGDSIELQTFGGTEWQWTPGILTKDSSYWKTFAYPDSTTEFRVIIRDSSGCGVTDTDYVVINVRPKLEIKTPFVDTSVCENQRVKFIANTFGGDTLHHVVNWFEKRNGTLIKLDSNTKNITVICDSFCKAQTELRDTGKIILAVLWDSCSAERDTQIYYLNANKDLKVKLFSDREKTIAFNDTVLCLGQSITLYPKGFGGNVSNYSYQWSVGGVQFLNADSAVLNLTKNSDYFVVLKDNCSPKNDTFSFKIFLNPALKSEILNENNQTKLPKDISLCFGQTMKFSSKISGGDTGNYSYQWTVGGLQFSNLDTFSYTFLKENTTEKIQFILTDNCTSKPDTSELNIFTKPKINIQSNPIDTLCLGENFVQKIKVSGGDSSKYSFQWSVGGLQFSSADSAKIPSDSSGRNSVKIIVKDGCTLPYDSLVLDYFVREKLEVSAMIADSFCSGNTINASALAKGGNHFEYSYQWSVNGVQFSFAQNFSFKIPQSDEGKLNEIKVKISDNCSQFSDSFLKEIFVTNPLKLSVAVDSNCVNNKAKIIATSTGGKASDYQFTFFVDDILKENNNTGIFNFADNKTTKINVKISDNCSANGDSLEIILPAFLPKISATINPTDACEPLDVFLKINNENGTENSYNWSLGNGEIISNILLDTASYTYPKSGTFIGNIKAKTKNNCEVDLVLDKVQVHPLPIVDFTWNPTIITLPNADVDFQNLSANKDKFNWSVNDSNFSQEFNTKYIFNDSGFYTIKLIAENEFHCMDSSIKKLFVKDLVSVFIPNAFTPNGDGLNDEFTPIVTGIESYEIQIYNRWGQQVFEGNMNNHWNGKYGNTNVADGIFIYQIRLLRTDKKVIYLNGSLNLLR